MGPVSEGADVARLEEIVARVTDLSHRTTDLAATGSAMLTVLADAWMGPDVEHFSREWSVASGHLDRSAGLLQQMGAELSRQVREQDATSQAKGAPLAGGRGGGTPTMPEPDDDNPGADLADLVEQFPLIGPGLAGLVEDYYNAPAATEIPEEHQPDDPGVGNVTLPEGADPKDPAIQEMLRSPRGRETLNWLAENGIAIEPNEGSGSEYNFETNTIELGYGDGADSLVHEAEHARQDIEGERVEVTPTNEAEYVEGQIQGEVQAVTEEIYLAKEQRAAGQTVEVDGFEYAYDTAYEDALESGSTVEEADAAGRDAVHEMFVEGEDGTIEAETSNSGQTYPEYYAEQHGDLVDG